MTPGGDFLFPLSAMSHLAPASHSAPNYSDLSPLAEQDHRVLLYTHYFHVSSGEWHRDTQPREPCAAAGLPRACTSLPSPGFPSTSKANAQTEGG